MLFLKDLNKMKDLVIYTELAFNIVDSSVDIVAQLSSTVNVIKHSCTLS